MRRDPFVLPNLATALAALAALAGAFIEDRRWCTVLSSLAAAAGLLVLAWLRAQDSSMEEVARTSTVPPDLPDFLPGIQRLVRTLQRARQQSERDQNAVNRARKGIAGRGEQLRSLTQRTTEVSRSEGTGQEQQLQAVKRLNGAWDQVSDMAERISGQADQVGSAAAGALSSCQQGTDATTAAVHEMERAKASSMVIGEHMHRLRDLSGQVEDTARAIDRVSTQVNLLALNAAIEAAGAGSYGERFGVVAVEVKQLADQTVEATRMIKQLLRAIQEEVSSGLELTEQSTSSVQIGYDQVRALESVLSGMRGAVEQADRNMRTILSSTKVQVFAVRNARKEIESIQSGLVAGSGTDSELTAVTHGLDELAERLREMENELA